MTEAEILLKQEVDRLSRENAELLSMNKIHCELHGLQDVECIACARKDLDGMREFQRKFIDADLKLRAAIERCGRLKGALQYYASDIYTRTVEDDLGYTMNPEEWIYSEPEVLEDGGEQARQALAEAADDKT